MLELDLRLSQAPPQGTESFAPSGPLQTDPETARNPRTLVWGLSWPQGADGRVQGSPMPWFLYAAAPSWAEPVPAPPGADDLQALLPT